MDRGERTGPLAGLPVVVKDNIQVQGLPASAGTPALQSVVSRQNAPIVQKLVDAGAIVVATTHMHELAFGISGYNPTYGTGPGVGVRNPYDTDRFAGGSSSGTGALVGAGAVTAGLGTDTGGSVRVPAAVNGVAGLRPTIGRYPADGIVPISSTRDTPGFIAATVADIELLDRVVTGAEPEMRPISPDCVSALRPRSARTSVRRSRRSGADVLARLEAAGVEIVKVDASEIVRRNAEISFPIALYEANTDLRAYLERHAPGIGIEEVVAGIRSPDVKATYEGLVLPRKLPTPDGALVDAEPVYRAAMREGRPALVAAYEALFAEAGIEALVFPTVPDVAVRRGRGLEQPRDVHDLRPPHGSGVERRPARPRLAGRAGCRHRLARWGSNSMAPRARTAGSSRSEWRWKPSSEASRFRRRGARSRTLFLLGGTEMSKEWPLWEVFIRGQHGLNHRHVGSLHAPDAEMAINNARDVYTRRNEGVSIWVVPSADDHRVEPVRQGPAVRAGQLQGLPPPDLLRHPRRSGAHVMPSLPDMNTPDVAELARDAAPTATTPRSRRPTPARRPSSRPCSASATRRSILGHRVSEWCGHAPALEEDIALANVALDLIGQTQMWLGLAGRGRGQGPHAPTTSPTCATPGTSATCSSSSARTATSATR